MADVQVKCINKQPRENPYEGITHLGGDDWKWTRQKVVDSIRAKTNTFYTLVSGNRGRVLFRGMQSSTFSSVSFGPIRFFQNTSLRVLQSGIRISFA